MDRHANNDDGQQQGGEVSMSIAETNRVRESLGLKPLSMESSSSKEDAAMRQRDQEAREKREKEDRAEAFKARTAE